MRQPHNASQYEGNIALADISVHIHCELQLPTFCCCGFSSLCRDYAVNQRKNTASHCATIFIFKYFQQLLNNPVCSEKDLIIGLKVSARKYKKIKTGRTLLVKYLSTCFSASMRSLTDFSGTTYFLEDKYAFKHLSG